MEPLKTENTTLQLLSSEKIKSIDDWEKSYPNLWLLIEVTREDFSQVYEGKLLALSENPVEFLQLKKSLKAKQIVNLTTRGISSNTVPTIWTKL